MTEALQVFYAHAAVASRANSAASAMESYTRQVTQPHATQASHPMTSPSFHPYSLPPASQLTHLSNVHSATIAPSPPSSNQQQAPSHQPATSPPLSAFVAPVPLTLATLPSLAAAQQKFFASPVMPATAAVNQFPQLATSRHMTLPVNTQLQAEAWQAQLMNGWMANLALQQQQQQAQQHQMSPPRNSHHRRTNSSTPLERVASTPSRLTSPLARPRKRSSPPGPGPRSLNQTFSPLTLGTSPFVTSPSHSPRIGKQRNTMPAMTLEALSNIVIPPLPPPAIASNQNQKLSPPMQPHTSTSTAANGAQQASSTLSNATNTATVSSPERSPRSISHSPGSPPGATSSLQPAPPSSPPPASGRSRKTLSSQKLPDSQASMRSAYLSVGGGGVATNAKHKSTPTSRRASVTATESLTMGLPVHLVTALNSAGLVSSLFTSHFSASTASTATQPSSSTSPLPSDSSSGTNSRRASHAPEDEPLSTGSPPMHARHLFPWSLAPEHVWPGGAAAGLPKVKSARNASELEREKEKEREKPGALSRLQSAPVPHSDGLSARASSSSLAVPSSATRRLSLMVTDPDNVERNALEKEKEGKEGGKERGEKTGEEAAPSTASKPAKPSSSEKRSSTEKHARPALEKTQSVLDKPAPPPAPLTEEERMARALSDAMFAAALDGEPGAGSKRGSGGGPRRKTPTEKEVTPPADSPTASPSTTQRKLGRIKLRRSLTAVGLAAAQAAEKAKAEHKSSNHSPVAESRASGSSTTATDSTQNLHFLSSAAKPPSSTSNSGAASPALRSGAASPMPSATSDPAPSHARSSGIGAVEEVNGVIYITREVEVEKKKVFVVDQAKKEREKQERLEKERKVKERQAERDRKKAEEAEEKRKKSEEAAAAKEASRLARERMTNLLAEQAKQKRLAEKLAEEAAEKERLANGVTTPDGPIRRIRLTPSVRTKEAEAEARRKAAREMHPDFEAEEAEDQVAEEESTPAAAAAASEEAPSAPATARRGTQVRNAGRATLSGGLSSLLAKPAPRAPKSVKKLILPRMVNAAKKGEVEELRKILLEEFGKGAGPEKLNKSGETKTEFMNRVDKNGSGVLHHSVWPGHLEFMSVALSHGANPNLQNMRKNGAIHLAVERGHEDVIRLLLRYGADPILINSNGHAPFQVLPSLKEQLQWASFLYLNLEAIWKVANPDWMPEAERDVASAEEKEDPAAAAAAAEEEEDEADGGTAADAGTRTPEAAGAVSPALTSPYGADTPPVQNGQEDPTGTPPTLAVLDASLDYTPLVSLSPFTPVWLAELSSVFQRKDLTRLHTKQLQSKVLTVMRMGLLKSIASATASSSSAKVTPVEGSLSPPGLLGDRAVSPLPSDLASQPSSARSTLASSAKSGGSSGLASLLRKIGGRAAPKRASGGGGGGGSGRSSQRSSVEAGATTPPMAGSRRSSTEGARAKLPPASPAPSTPAPVTPAAKTAHSPNPSLDAGTSAAALATPASAVASPDASRPISPTPVAAPLKFTLEPAPLPVVTGPVAAVKTSSIFSASLEDMQQEPAPTKKFASFWPFGKK